MNSKQYGRYSLPGVLLAVLTAGTDERCRNEGESITVAGITDDPCIRCFCRVSDGAHCE